MKMSKSILAATVFAICAGLGCKAKLELKTPEPAPVEEPAPEPEPEPEPEPAYIEISDRIQFQTGRAVLLPQSLKVLDEVKSVLKENDQIALVEMEGHTDSTGQSEANHQLSQRRAEAVRDYLVQGEIDADRLVAKGYGQENPVADNDSAEGREQNRRVEFKIVKPGG